MENKAFGIGPKGLAIIAAVESGLLPKIGNEGWDDSKFHIFWAMFTKDLRKQGREYLEHHIEMFYQKG